MIKTKEQVKEGAIKLIIDRFYEMEEKYKCGEMLGVEQGLGKHKLDDGRKVFIKIELKVIK